MRIAWTRSSSLIEVALTLLRRAGVRLEAGLSGAELGAVQSRFGFDFAPDHAALLTERLPAGDGWPDWRHGTAADLQARLDGPVDGALFDVSENGFWPVSWGDRPDDPDEAIRRARVKVLRWPTMVPVYRHRYLTAGPDGKPVFSIHQTDVIYYGADLVDYLGREFGSVDRRAAIVDPLPIWPWSSLALGADNEDL